MKVRSSRPGRRAPVPGTTFDQARPMKVSNWSKVSSATEVAYRAGPEGQCVDTAVEDYSLSPPTLPVSVPGRKTVLDEVAAASALTLAGNTLGRTTDSSAGRSIPLRG